MSAFVNRMQWIARVATGRRQSRLLVSGRERRLRTALSAGPYRRPPARRRTSAPSAR